LFGRHGGNQRHGREHIHGRMLAQNPLLLLNKSAGLTAFGGPLRVGRGDASQKEVRWLQITNASART
jgi:hypothetical protein